MARRNRRRKNNFSDLIFPITLLLFLLVYFNTDFFIGLFKFIFFIFLLGSILYWLFKLIFTNTPVPINRDYLHKRKKETPTTRTPITNPNSSKPTSEPRGYSSFNNNTPDIPTTWSLTLLQEMDWKHFEELCFNYFELLDYKPKMSSQGADEGVDIYLYKNNQPNKLFGMVQCKCWKKPVGVEPVRAFFGVQTDKQLPLAIFISSAGFSKTAISFCANKHLKLISVEELLHQIQKMPQKTQQDLLQKATKGDYKTPTCVKCDSKMVVRKSKKSGKEFWGCKNYPKCKTTLYISPEVYP